jgi:hypothetical protein
MTLTNSRTTPTRVPVLREDYCLILCTVSFSILLRNDTDALSKGYSDSVIGLRETPARLIVEMPLQRVGAREVAPATIANKCPKRMSL